MKSNWMNPIERWKSCRNGTLLEFARDSQGRPASLPQSILSSHALVIGEAEEEKLNFLTQLACFYVKAGRSMIVVDADGTLVDALQGVFPRDVCRR